MMNTLWVGGCHVRKKTFELGLFFIYQNHEKPCLSNFNTCVTGNKNVNINQGNLVSCKTNLLFKQTKTHMFNRHTPILSTL